MSQISGHDAAATIDCKVPECTNEARTSRGPYAYLCDVHKHLSRQAGGNGVGPKHRGIPLAGDGFEAKVIELRKLGRDADRAKQRAEEATLRALALKREAETAQATFAAAFNALAQQVEQ